MEPGERTTGTRDEQYNLISVLYHALHGAENCNTYALDAEAAGDERLMAFFREVGVLQTRLAEQAKEMLGIIEVPPEPAIRPEGPVASNRVYEPSPAGGSPASDVTRPEEDFVAEDVATGDPRSEGHITPEDFDPTISVLEGGISQIEIGRAVAEIETWERKLEATGEPELQSIAGNLGALRALLTADDLDVAAAGPLLTTLGVQVQRVASSGAGAPVAEKLQRLSELLTNQGRSLSG